MFPVQSCIPDVLADLLRQQPLSPAKVVFAWSTAVGASLGRATTARLGPEGQLVVLVTDPHWQREVQRSVDLIAARLERLLGPGVVNRIVVKLRAADRQAEVPESHPPPRTGARR